MIFRVVVEPSAGSDDGDVPGAGTSSGEAILLVWVPSQPVRRVLALQRVSLSMPLQAK
eukprot:CAMPEP_0194765288 /NCGR_PEP_ID=MMETSP0323_2-20130528/25879_1 /TAXON_ID=2866 ORGANISM="Crypthecodinium cohnii, Strain Seligo" /NCGR_SAMPLE_ID=MMETSP0323_2 /ASSEMBLY_ACC=CAM_ASM_000346 /LENGTH=57 /DNA_ID=CAMNT_0039694433 /DNA_START=370 /DNA_END=540 /DNA_ORIENTATION=-